MFLESLISTVAKVAKVNIRNDDDLCDRLNHRYTVIFLFIFTVLVSTTQYVGNPIHCWCPAYFTSNHEEFTDKVCWVSNNYYLPEDSVAGQSGVLKQHIGYYQWVPVVLLIQAFLFYLPCLVWRVFSDRSGININNLVEAAETIQNALYPERRDKTIKYMIRHLDHYLDYQREYRGGCCVTCKHFFAKHLCLICGNRYGNYLVALYMSVKVLYFCNLICQLFLLNGFLGTDYHLYGFEIIKDLITGQQWSASRRFPRITLCDFVIRQMGNVHRHTVQCVLPINLFNEKIYIFLWFWFVFVAAATVGSFLRWFWTIGFRYSRIRYIRKHLKIMDKLNRDSDRDRKLSHKFAEMYLRQDGCFVLKLVAKNSTDLVVADIVAALWDNYRNKPIHRSDTEMGEDSGSVP
jgi:hypothetical protein